MPVEGDSDGTFTPPMQGPSLRGIVLRDEADLIVVRATPEDVRRFATANMGQPVNLRRADVRLRFVPLSGGTVVMAPGPVPPRFTEDGAPAELDPDGLLYNARGMPVAQVTSVRLNVHPVDVSTMGDVYRTFAAGRRSLDVEVQVLPGVTLATSRV